MQPLPRHIRMRSAAGFSLVELMVAIAISLLLLAGVVAIFASSRVSYESNDQLSRVQETGRFALEAISRQVRSAGFGGCSRQPNYVSTALNSTGTLQWNFLEGPVRGYNASGSAWVPTLDASITGAAAGSDVLVLRGPRPEAQPAIVTTNMASPTDPLVVSGGSIVANDVVMAYSCEGQAFFQVTAVGGSLLHAATGASPGNANASTSYQFKRNAEVVLVATTVYFVGPSVGATAPNNTRPIGTHSLYRQVGSRA
ncbi:PilW family protein, partial [Steroidobacter sp.]|uniref:PilW family protein n=1 Tax=Steroidobacter sp. TaxID=1978227 RepID=UPI001A453021